MVRSNKRPRPASPENELSQIMSQISTACEEHKVKGTTFLPNMTSFEHTDKDTGSTMVTVMLGLPGLQSKDVVIDLLYNKLTISGESAEPPLAEGNYIVRQLQYGRFSRTVTVPLGMRLEDFKASMEDGLLVVTFPKDVPDAKPQRISIGSTHVRLENL